MVRTIALLTTGCFATAMNCSREGIVTRAFAAIAAVDLKVSNIRLRVSQQIDMAEQEALRGKDSLTVSVWMNALTVFRCFTIVTSALREDLAARVGLALMDRGALLGFRSPTNETDLRRARVTHVKPLRPAVTIDQRRAS